ncbi:hypothetical protein RJT34_20370 [Clitoria ternatea]|uniref:Uncharacterized protein n=1 Tax=Clitoria ternatea TaxID=43366 RepID=A0AAN9ITC8_CLITE
MSPATRDLLKDVFEAYNDRDKSSVHAHHSSKKVDMSGTRDREARTSKTRREADILDIRGGKHIGDDREVGTHDREMEIGKLILGQKRETG